MLLVSVVSIGLVGAVGLWQDQSWDPAASEGMESIHVDCRVNMMCAMHEEYMKVDQPDELRVATSMIRNGSYWWFQSHTKLQNIARFQHSDWYAAMVRRRCWPTCTTTTTPSVCAQFILGAHMSLCPAVIEMWNFAFAKSGTFIELWPHPFWLSDMNVRATAWCKNFIFTAASQVYNRLQIRTKVQKYKPKLTGRNLIEID